MKDLTVQQVASITNAFTSSQIHYEDKYILPFGAYNAWYRAVTGELIDSKALQAIKLRDALWAEYHRGECLGQIRPLIRHIALLTHLRPLRAQSNWSGVVTGPDDWEGLIDYWYTVRCDVVHANSALLLAHYQTVLRLAYDTLQIFMTEVVMRLQLNALSLESERNEDTVLPPRPRLDEVDLHPRAYFLNLRKKLLRKPTIPLSKHFTS